MSIKRNLWQKLEESRSEAGERTRKIVNEEQEEDIEEFIIRGMKECIKDVIKECVKEEVYDLENKGYLISSKALVKLSKAHPEYKAAVAEIISA